MERSIRKFLLALFSPFLFSCQTPPCYIDARFQSALDRQPIPLPKKKDASEDWDRLYNEFFRFVYNAGDLPFLLRRTAEESGLKSPREASNVNAWDEVPDSSWFTNRIGKQSWTPEQAARGPRHPLGPDLNQPWRVVSGKSEGQTAGFTIIDSRHDMYFIKFDPPGFKRLSSGAEVISSLILYSLGYNVPSYYALTVSPKIFQLAENAKTEGRYGEPRPMTEEDLQRILGAAPTEHGMFTVSASLALEGKPVGQFAFEGRRDDDPNDKIDHENRRELRAYYIFSSLINNTDTRRQNTLDTYVGPPGAGYIRHNFLDFGTTLGSAGYRPKDPRDGYEFYLDYGEIGLNFLALGTREPYWLNTRSSRHHSVGIFEARLFDPLKWRPAYPTAAFYLITPHDAFWATKLLMKLSDDHIKAIVKEGNYTDSFAEEYLSVMLTLRRDKIGRLWFRRMTPLDDFHLRSDPAGLTLSLTDLTVETDLFPGFHHRYLASIHFANASFPSNSTNTNFIHPRREYRSETKTEFVGPQSISSHGQIEFRFRFPERFRPPRSFIIDLTVQASDLSSGKIASLGKGIRLHGLCIPRDDCQIVSVQRHNP